MSAPTDAEKLAAVIEQLEAERRRREDDRIAAGTAIRLPLLVVAPPDAEEADKVIEQTKAAKLAALRAEGFDGEVYFEPEPICTGVPRCPESYERARYNPGSVPPAPKPNTAARSYQPPSSPPPPAPLDWKPIQTQVSPPDDLPGTSRRAARAVASPTHLNGKAGHFAGVGEYGLHGNA
jgi:hypothetical protein